MTIGDGHWLLSIEVPVVEVQVNSQRLQVRGHRSEVGGHRSQVGGCRSQVTGRRLILVLALVTEVSNYANPHFPLIDHTFGMLQLIPLVASASPQFLAVL